MGDSCGLLQVDVVSIFCSDGNSVKNTPRKTKECAMQWTEDVDVRNMEGNSWMTERSNSIIHGVMEGNGCDKFLKWLEDVAWRTCMDVCNRP